MPNQCGKAHRHRYKERAPPSDQPAEETAERRSKDEREGGAALKQGDGLGQVGSRCQARQDSGRERPEAADRDADQCSSDQKDDEAGREGNGQNRGDQHRRIKQDDRFPVEPGQEGIAEQAGDDGEEPGNGNRLSGLTFRDGQVVGNRSEETHRHELQADEEKGQQREAGNGSPWCRRPFCRKGLAQCQFDGHSVLSCPLPD
ncbi:hypothetical protein ABIA23_004744 [Sinorhizobium fredii]